MFTRPGNPPVIPHRCGLVTHSHGQTGSQCSALLLIWNPDSPAGGKEVPPHTPPHQAGGWAESQGNEKHGPVTERESPRTSEFEDPRKSVYWLSSVLHCTKVGRVLQVPKPGADVGVFLQNRQCAWEVESFLHVRARLWVARRSRKYKGLLLLDIRGTRTKTTISRYLS